MILDDLLRLSLAEIWYHKIQSLLIIGSVAIGIFAIFTLNSIGTGIKETMFGYLESFGTDTASLYPSSQGMMGAGSYFSESDVRKVEGLPGVKRVCPAIVGIEELDGLMVWVIGMPTDCYDWFAEKGFYNFEQGGWGVAVGKILWEDLDLEVAETIEIQDKKFRITGLLKTIGSEQDDMSVYMTVEDAEKIYGKDKYYWIMLQIAGDIENLQNAVDHEFKDRSVELSTFEQMFSQIGSILDTINLAVLGIAFISLLVGAITISNTVYATIKRRTREIGMYKAIGAENNEILILFIMESAILSSAGGILGIGTGYLTAKLIAAAIERFMLFTPSTDPALIFGSFVVALLIGPLSALIPAMHAAKLDPTEALRYE